MAELHNKRERMPAEERERYLVEGARSLAKHAYEKAPATKIPCAKHSIPSVTNDGRCTHEFTDRSDGQPAARHHRRPGQYI